MKGKISISEICRSAGLEIEKSQKEEAPLWFTLLHASGIFLSITFVVFFIVNFHFIESQLSDWWNEKNYSGVYAYREKEDLDISSEIGKFGNIDPLDSDDDNLEDFFEFLLGTNPQKIDTDDDGFDDYKELSRGYNPAGSGMLGINMEVPGIGENIEIFNPSNSQALQKITHNNQTPFVGAKGNSLFEFDELGKINPDISTKLGNIKKGDIIIINIGFPFEKKIKLTYKVKYTDKTSFQDPKVFRDYDGYEITLLRKMTNEEILIVKAELFNIE